MESSTFRLVLMFALLAVVAMSAIRETKPPTRPEPYEYADDHRAGGHRGDGHRGDGQRGDHHAYDDDDDHVDDHDDHHDNHHDDHHSDDHDDHHGDDHYDDHDDDHNDDHSYDHDDHHGDHHGGDHDDDHSDDHDDHHSDDHDDDHDDDHSYDHDHHHGDHHGGDHDDDHSDDHDEHHSDDHDDDHYDDHDDHHSDDNDDDHYNNHSDDHDDHHGDDHSDDHDDDHYDDHDDEHGPGGHRKYKYRAYKHREGVRRAYRHRAYDYKADDCHEVCGINAKCVKHSCRCRHGFTGNPRFACHKKNTAFCSITSDPSLVTFGKEHFSLEHIADVKAAEVTTNRRAKGKGECNLKVWTFFNRVEGKFFVTELQAKLTIMTDYKSTATILKIVTFIDCGVYVFKVYHFDGNCFNLLFVDRSDSPVVVTNFFTIRSVQLEFSRVLPGLLQVEIDKCGITFGVRPHNENKPQIVPGFVIEVDKSFNPTFFPEDLPTIQICLSDNNINLTKLTTFKDDVDSLVLIALTNSEVEPPFNATPSNLAGLRSILRRCCDEDKLRFVHFFRSVLGRHPFVKAISGGVPGLSELVRFLSLVLKDICGLDAWGCDQAEDLIRKRADKSNVELLKPYCSHYEGKKTN